MRARAARRAVLSCSLFDADGGIPHRPRNERLIRASCRATDRLAVALYPGTRHYESSGQGGIDDSVWFGRGDAGLDLRMTPSGDDQRARHGLGAGSRFPGHGQGLRAPSPLQPRVRVTRILRGRFLDETLQVRGRCYAASPSFPPTSGFLRTGKLIFRHGRFRGRPKFCFSAPLRAWSERQRGAEAGESELAAGMRGSVGHARQPWQANASISESGI
jgi:hypothetical protein